MHHELQKWLIVGIAQEIYKTMHAKNLPGRQGLEIGQYYDELMHCYYNYQYCKFSIDTSLY